MRHNSFLQMSRARAWCFTINNIADDFTPEGLHHALEAVKCRYLVFQKELSPTTKKEHIQGYVSFSGVVRFNAIQKVLPGAHLEVAKGSALQNKAYCTKEDSRLFGPWEFGDAPQPGKRKDIDVVREMVRAGKKMREIAEVVSSYQGLKFASEYIKYQPVPDREPPLVYWLHGSTGSGKTRWAYERAKDCGVELCRIDSTEKSVFFDPYVDQCYVLFDDYRPQRMPFSQLLSVTDRYPMRVRVLYGTVLWVPEIIVFTCPYSIEECFKYRCEEDLTQLKRRVSFEMLFGDRVKRSQAAQASCFVNKI